MGRSALPERSRPAGAPRRLLTSLFTLLIFLLGVYYDLLRHPTEINVLICLVMLIQLLLFDARPGHNLTVSLSGLAVVVLWECYVPDPHRLINIMYCFLASLIGLYLPGTRSTHVLACCCMAHREKAAVEKETSTQAAVSQFQPHFISNMLSTIQILCDDAPAKAKGLPWPVWRITCGSAPIPSTITGWSLSRGS